MKTIKAYEFKDLSKEVKKEVLSKETEEEVMFQLEVLDSDLENEYITEEDYYERLGCDKNYAETTAWFVPSCYYDENKKQVDKEVKNILKEYLFTIKGRFIQRKD